MHLRSLEGVHSPNPIVEFLNLHDIVTAT
uniref:Uncharacterized protein n=1 Tax=Rhizophora mucronata TaxID=61149 RepID=A0A2P2IIH1_RHIMU